MSGPFAGSLGTDKPFADQHDLFVYPNPVSKKI